MYSACKNRGTAWEVLKFATSKEQDGAVAGRRPARCRCARTCAATYPDYFAKNPAYKDVRRPGRAHGRGAERAELDRRSGRPSGTRTAKSVIFGESDPGAALDDAAQQGRSSSPAQSMSSIDGHDDSGSRVAGTVAPQPAGDRLLGRQPIGIAFVAPYVVFLAAVFAYPLGLRGLHVASTTTSSPRPARSWTGRSSGFDNYADGAVATRRSARSFLQRRRSSW